jgi:apoptotic chromatin condensation inducer in the nucleus
LKDELERRYLPVSGLKDDLLKRLFEVMQDEILDGEGKATGVTFPPEELKGGETPGSIDASVNQASIEQHVDKGASEVAKQGADLVISVTEAYDESTFATSEVTQVAVVGTAEANQKSLDAVAEVESSLVDTAATDETNGDGLDSASSGNTIVKEANPHSEGHGDTIEKNPEDDTNKKMAVDDEPSNLTGGDIKLGLDEHSKILKLEDEPAPPDDMLHSDHEDSDAVAVAEPEDDTSKKMIIDDVPSGPTHTNVELGAKVDCKIEQEEVSILSDATALHAYPKEHIVAAAKGLALPRRTLMSGYTSDIDLDRKEESPDRNSREKLNLDRSSGDESMDEDVMESKHADSYIKPDDLIGKTEVTSEHVFKEVSLLDTHAEGSSAHSKEVVTEEKPPTPTEKRKPEG